MPPPYGELEHRGIAPVAVAAAGPAGEDQVWIGAASPLLSYSPGKGGPDQGSGWVLTSQGYIQAQGSEPESVTLCELTYSSLVWTWTGTRGYIIGVGLDGTEDEGPATSGGVTLSGAYAKHTAKLAIRPSGEQEEGCASCGGGANSHDGSQVFQLTGARINTRLTPSGTPVNTTVDDASPQIKYSGFSSVSTSTAQLDAIRNGRFYQTTVSYTSSQGASASFSFRGSALYVFGPTGQGFQRFQATIDSVSFGTFDGKSSVDTYDTLVFFVSGLSEGTHQVVLTNQDEGGLFALDYFVAVSSASTATNVPPNNGETVAGGGGAGPSTPAGPGPTSVFGNPATSDRGSGATTGVIGGVLGALFGLMLLFVAWRYYQYRKDGGKGDFFTALCGPRKRAQVQKAGPAKDDFKIWPMMRFRPKYAT